jgi:hypothetical protein
VPDGCSGADASEWARLAGSARHLDRHGRQAAVAEDDHRVGRAQREVGQDLGGEPLGALDEHRLPLAVRADDLRVEGHRELDDRVEPRIRAVAREHLLDGDPRVAGAEDVHEAAAADRVRADLARALHRLALGLEPLEERLRGLEVRGDLDGRVGCCSVSMHPVV